MRPGKKVAICRAWVLAKSPGLGDEAYGENKAYAERQGSGTVAQCGKHSESLNTMQIFYRHSMKLLLR